MSFRTNFGVFLFIAGSLMLSSTSVLGTVFTLLYDAQTVKTTGCPNPYVVTLLQDNADVPTCGSLRYAINAANNAASAVVITFDLRSSRIITLNGAPLSINGKNSGLITIDGGAGGVTIHAKQDSRIMKIDKNNNIALQHLTVENGTSGLPYTENYYGGGIVNAGTLTIIDSTISGNATDSKSGAGLVNNGVATIVRSTFSDNLAFHASGGAAFNDGTMIISNSTFTHNDADAGEGGGIYNIGTIIINNSTFSGNAADGGSNGGGVANDGTATIINSTFSNNYNTALSNGGVSEINSCTFSDNVGLFYSALYNYGTMTISNSTIADKGNDDIYGDAVANNGALTISNSTVFGNRGNSGISNASTATVNLFSSIVSGNSGKDISGTINDLGYNLIGGNPGFGTLADNGGATETVALAPSSPAYQAGSCDGYSGKGIVIAPVDTDQRGQRRKHQCDIGAYEYQLSPASTTPLPTSKPVGTNTATPTSPRSAVLSTVQP